MTVVGWLAGFGLTLAVELPCYLLGALALGWVATGTTEGPSRVRERVRPRVPVATFLLVVVAVDLVTHPVLWVTSAQWTSVGDLLRGELVVVLVEGVLIAVLLRRGRRRRDLGWTLLLALAANAASVLVGLLVLR
jgi:hypothetical protein